jgi:hypothetical protein
MPGEPTDCFVLDGERYISDHSQFATPRCSQ